MPFYFKLISFVALIYGFVIMVSVASAILREIEVKSGMDGLGLVWLGLDRLGVERKGTAWEGMKNSPHFYRDLLWE